MPYFGWARQDRKDKPRVSIAAKLVANLLTTAGVDRVIAMDLHADQIQGFFDIPVDHLYASSVFIPYIQSLNLKDLVIASPDVGGAKRANSYAKYLNVPLVQECDSCRRHGGHSRHYHKSCRPYDAVRSPQCEGIMLPRHHERSGIRTCGQLRSCRDYVHQFHTIHKVMS